MKRIFYILMVSYCVSAAEPPASNQTALHKAAGQCDFETAQELVRSGVDRNARDSANRTAAMIAMKCSPSIARDKLINVLTAPLVPKPSDESAYWSLQDTAARGNIQRLNMLLKLRGDVNAVGSKGNTALEIACRKGRADVAAILLDHGADLRLRTTAGTTMMHEAALGDSPEVIELLLARGAEVNAMDTETAATPLHFAASFGRLKAVKALLRIGADVNSKNAKSETPLQTAVSNGQNDVAEVLRSAKNGSPQQ